MNSHLRKVGESAVFVWCVFMQIVSRIFKASLYMRSIFVSDQINMFLLTYNDYINKIDRYVERQIDKQTEMLDRQIDRVCERERERER